MTNKKCDVCGRELEEDDGYLSCPVYMDGIEKNSDEHTSAYIPNKEMFNMNAVRATTDSVGEWDGQEELAAENFNQIQDALYEAAPDEYNDDQLHELMKAAWDKWGSECDLLTATDKQIAEYVESVV